MSFIPNSFQLPNALVDEGVMVEMKGAALAMYIVIVRKTRGWQKETDAISISQFMKFTGYGKDAVISGAEKLVSLGLVDRISRDHQPAFYTLSDLANREINNLSEKPTSSNLSEKTRGVVGKTDKNLSEKPTHNNNKTIIKNNTHTHAVGDENEWSPNLENLKAVLSTTRFSHLVDSIVGMPDFAFHLGNFNAHWENKTSLTENQKTRKFAQWITLEFEKAQKKAVVTQAHGAKKPHQYSQGFEQPTKRFGNYQEEQQFKDVN